MTTKLQLGLEYEKYTQEIIKPNYKNVWLWSEVPNDIMKKLGFVNAMGNNCDDIGCDLIAETMDNKYHFIQCKNYSTTGNDNTINIGDLAGFYNFIAERELARVSFVYYSGKLSSQIICRQSFGAVTPIKYVNLPYVMFKSIDNINCVPRDYQIKAYDFLKSKQRSVLNMPCGTGKTLVEYLLSLDVNTTIILSPLISTSEQTIAHFKNYYSKTKDINFIEINCSVGRDSSKFKFSDKNIISSTYDSVDVINKILSMKTTSLGTTLLIIDEFHNLTQNDLMFDKSEIRQLLNTNIKTLFVSATPKYINGFDYGEIFKLNWKDAIQNKYICDFNFLFPDNKKIEGEVHLLKINTDLTKNIILINKAHFMLSELKKLNSKKCITFLRSVEECEEFVKILHTVNIFTKLDCIINQITYLTSKKDRTKILQSFNNSNNKVNIICNVHVLDEGIDVPKCDFIFVANPTDNIINLTQRISRCNRIDQTNPNKVGNVLLWTDDKECVDKVIQYVEQFVDVKVIANAKNINNMDTDNEEYEIPIKKANKKVIRVKNSVRVKSKYIPTETKLTDVHYCGDCKYYSNLLANFKRHCDSQQHIENTETKLSNEVNYKKYKCTIFCCDECGNVYMSKRSLNKHQESCKKDPVKSLKRENEKLKHDLQNEKNIHDKRLDKILEIVRK